MDQNASLTYDLDLFFKDTLWGKIHLATAVGYVHNQIFNDPKHVENKINLKKSIYPDYDYHLVAYPIFTNNIDNGTADHHQQEREEMIHKVFIKPVEMNILKN